MNAVLSIALAFSLQLLTFSLAQSLSLEQALSTAFKQGPDLATSGTTLQNAKADLASKEGDPSSLILVLTSARNTSTLEQTRYDLKRLEVMQGLLGAYINLYEAQENLKVLEAQLALDTRTLQIAKEKLASKNGTQLDVDKAEATLASSRQNLADAKAQLPIFSSRLAVYLGGNPGNLTVTAPPAFKEAKLDLASLEANLDSRLPSVLQAVQGVQTYQLQVKLYDNDYTAPATLRDAKTNLENAQRSLETTRQNALTSLRDSYRSLQNALEKVRIAGQDLSNAEASLTQDQAKYKSGTISRQQLQQTEMSTLRSRYSYLQASNNYWKALASLSTASGMDCTGMLKASL